MAQYKCMRFKPTHHVGIGLAVEALSEDGDDEHVDPKRAEQGEERLDEVVLVRLGHFILSTPVDKSTLNRGMRCWR